MHKEFEDYESTERLLSILKSSETRRRVRTRMQRRQSSLNKARLLFVVLISALFFTAAVIEFYVAPNMSNDSTEEKVVENVAEGTAEVTAFKMNNPTSSQPSSSEPTASPEPIATSYAYIGQEFTITHYCGCSVCCGKWSSGSEDTAYGCKGDKLTPYYSIATDPNVIPYGTIVHDQHGNEYKAVDTGSAIKGNKIDLFVGDHQEALNLGIGTIYLYW